MQTAEQAAQSVKQAVDMAVVAGAVTSPLWVRITESWLSFAMLIGGAVLLLLRLAIAWREWRKDKADK